MSKLIVFDFDGTVTDAEAEGLPFRDGYFEDLDALTGLGVDEIRRRAEIFEEEVSSNPGAYGWVYQGEIVAPALVDPYLRMMPVARKMLDSCGRFMDPEDRNRLLDNILYKYNYQKTTTVFREGAGSLLASLQGTATYVVTNSHTHPVQDKLRSLIQGGLDLQWLVERVHGSAKKYKVDDSLTEVPASIRLPGLERPVLLRRKHYFQVLKGLLDQEALSWEDLIVIGDIFELDLALPLSLGASVGLVVNPFTPSYEKEFVAGHPRGRLLFSSAAAGEWLSELRGG